MNKELIAQMREAIDNMDDYARMADIKATGPLAVLSRGAEALEELERKLDVAREALSAMWLHYKSLVDSGDAGNWTPEDEPVCKQAVEALAQIGGEAMNNKELIERPLDNEVKDCCSQRKEAADALEAADKRIAELEAELYEQARLVGMGGEREAALIGKLDVAYKKGYATGEEEAERKLDVAREALEGVISWSQLRTIENVTSRTDICGECVPIRLTGLKTFVEALEQIGGDDECRVSSAYSGPSNCNRGTVGCINPAHRVWKGAEGGNDVGFDEKQTARIGELAATCAELERKLDVAREALEGVVAMPRSAESIRRCTQALAQIGEKV